MLQPTNKHTTTCKKCIYKKYQYDLTSFKNIYRKTKGKTRLFNLTNYFGNKVDSMFNFKFVKLK